MKSCIWRVITVLGVLLFFGCGDSYSQFCGDSKAKIHCLKAADETSEAVMRRYLKRYASSDQCAHTLKVVHYEPKVCSNPSSKALGTDVDGFVRLQVFSEGVCYYRVQRDYKSRQWEDLLPSLTHQMERELLLP
jgi:hypothetical protein